MNEDITCTISPEDEEFLMGLATDENENLDRNEAAADEASVESAEEKAAEYIRMIGELEEKLRVAEEERAIREKELSCLGILSDAGLPAELLPTVILSEDMAGTVELIRRTVQSLVDSEVSKRCRTVAPLAGSRAPLTKEELMRLPVAELQRMRDSGFAVTPQ